MNRLIRLTTTKGCLVQFWVQGGGVSPYKMPGNTCRFWVLKPQMTIVTCCSLFIGAKNRKSDFVDELTDCCHSFLEVKREKHLNWISFFQHLLFYFPLNSWISFHYPLLFNMRFEHTALFSQDWAKRFISASAKQYAWNHNMINYSTFLPHFRRNDASTILPSRVVRFTFIPRGMASHLPSKTRFHHR